MDWKNKWLPLAGLVFMVITSATVSRCFFKKPDFETQMQDIALELNGRAPFMVDDQTRFDSAVVQNGREFGYYFTLIHEDMKKDSIDVVRSDAVFRPIVENFVRTNPGMEVFRKNRATIVYSYYDGKSHFITRIRVGPDAYLSPGS